MKKIMMLSIALMVLSGCTRSQVVSPECYGEDKIDSSYCKTRHLTTEEEFFFGVSALRNLLPYGEVIPNIGKKEN